MKRNTLIAAGCSFALVLITTLVISAFILKNIPDDTEVARTENEDIQLESTPLMEPTEMPVIEIIPSYKILTETADEYIGEFEITAEDLNDLDFQLQRGLGVYELDTSEAINEVFERYVDYRGSNPHENAMELLEKYSYSSSGRYLEYQSNVSYDTDILSENSYLYTVEFYDEYGTIFGELKRYIKDGIIETPKGAVGSSLEMWATFPFNHIKDGADRWLDWKTEGMYRPISYTLDSYKGIIEIYTTIADLSCRIDLHNYGEAYFDFGDYGNFSCAFTLTYEESVTPDEYSQITSIYDLSVLDDKKYLYTIQFYDEYGTIFSDLNVHRKDEYFEYAIGNPARNLTVYSNSPFANLNNKLWSSWGGSSNISYNLRYSTDSATIQTTIANLACTIRMSSDGTAIFDFGTYGSFSYNFVLIYEKDTTNPLLDDLAEKLLSGKYMIEAVNYKEKLELSQSNVSYYRKGYYDHTIYRGYVADIENWYPYTGENYSSEINGNNFKITELKIGQYVTYSMIQWSYDPKSGSDANPEYQAGSQDGDGIVVYDDGRCNLGYDSWILVPIE